VHERAVSWTPLFNGIVIALLALGAVSFIMMFVLPGIWPSPTSSQSAAEQSVGFAFFTILGCFVGIVTGKLA
jgi:hypothetical protein